MITVGSTVRVTRLPENNGYWGIPNKLVNAIGVVTNIETERVDGGRIYVTIGRDEWYFPYSQIGVLVPHDPPGKKEKVKAERLSDIL